MLARSGVLLSRFRENITPSLSAEWISIFLHFCPASARSDPDSSSPHEVLVIVERLYVFLLRRFGISNHPLDSPPEPLISLHLTEDLL